jgi:hypothetical protein
MDELASFVAATDHSLMALRADEAAVLAMCDWPKQRYDAMRQAVGTHRELTYLQARAVRWMLEQGSCAEETARIEVFFDTGKARVEAAQAKQESLERRCTTEKLPWDKLLYRKARHSFLNLAVLYMSRILFEVANLERDTVLQNEACLIHSGEAVRMAYKTHQFAGGFNGDCNELFHKVKRLSQYYMRTLDPTWLKDNTKFAGRGTQEQYTLTPRTSQ